ncbi:MAG: diacylglycerol/lipid kinase family protein [Candidatus Zixiibacteriota bacterium]
MIRRRHEKRQHAHYCLLVNKVATNHDPTLVTKLTSAIRKKGGFYTIYESDSASELIQKAEIACRLKWRSRPLPDYLQQRGPITALVACGGDGTFNLAAQAALAAELPVGVLPMGRFNNIARSLLEPFDMETAIQKILQRAYRRIDTASVAGRLVVGSIGVGFIPEIARLLQGKKLPKFAFRWSQLGAQAATAAQAKKVVLKIDSFRFELRPTILNINLLPYSVGLRLSPVSIFDDRRAETIFDVGRNAKDFSSFVRLIYKEKYVYGEGIRLFRGGTVTFQTAKGQTAYLDGEFVDLQANIVEVQVNEKQLKVFC